MSRRLAVKKIGKKKYFVDERLKQLRNIRNPHDFFDFTDSEWGILELFDISKLKGSVRED